MISGVVKSFASLTIIRILSRVLQFFLRVYLIRQVLSPQILAEMVALDLILSTSLHITKSCFKLSYQQVQSKNKKQNVISSMNLMTIGVVATLISSIVVIFLQWDHKIETNYVHQTILLYGLCSFVEALKQKYSVQFVLGYQYKKIALIQLASYLPKTLLLFIAAKTNLFATYGILMFGIGNFVYHFMCFILTFYLTHYKIILFKTFTSETQNKQLNSENKKLDEKSEPLYKQAYLDNKTKKILKQLSYISILKLILQQFQKIVLVMKNAVEDSSIYSLVSNLGSIIVRFVFAPLEQISYNYYARGTQQQSKKTLLTLVKSLTIMCFLCIGFGFRYAQNVLYILYGQKWVNADSILAFQSFMILVGIMGLNGSIDSFVMARADVVKTVPKLKYFTILSTAVYFGSSFLFLHLGYGAAGLFLGNCTGMISRILINWNIQIKRHIKLGQFIKGIIPNKIFLLLLTSSIIMSYKIRSLLKLNLYLDFVVGLLLCGITVLPILYQFKDQIIKYIRKVKLGAKEQKIE